METIGVFGVSGFTVGIWVIVFVASSSLATALYRLNFVLPTGQESTTTAGVFAIVAHLIGIIFGMLSLVTWWTSAGFWPSFMVSGFRPFLVSLLSVAFVLAGPLVAGRLIATLK